MKIKLTAIIAIVVLMLTSMISVNALTGVDMDTLEVKLNGETISNGAKIAVMKGEDITAKVCFTPDQDVNSYFEFAIVGGKYRDLDMRADTGAKVKFFKDVKDCAQATFKINTKVEMGNYTLRVFSFDRNSDSKTSVADYNIFVVGKQDELVFEKVSMSNSVMAGKQINPKVFVRNNGREDVARADITAELRTLSGTVVAKSNIVSVEDLDVNAMNKPSEEMQIEVPATLAPGVYEVAFVAQFNDDYATSEATRTITVEKCLGQCAGKVTSQAETVITAEARAKEVGASGSAVYSVSIKNEGSRAVAYTVKVDGADFAIAEVQPTNFFTVEAGKAKDINVVITPKAGAAKGDHEFGVTVVGEDEVVADLSLVATVVDGSSVAPSWANIKNGLQIGFVVLFVLLVILALIVVLNRFKGKDSEEDEDMKGQTYY